MTRNGHEHALNRAHRQRFVLSGLLVCGVCGGGYTVMAKDRYGCAAHRQRGTCANDSTILRQEIEARVLSGLKERLLAPELFQEFARSYQEEVTAAAREQDAAHARRTRARRLRQAHRGQWLLGVNFFSFQLRLHLDEAGVPWRAAAAFPTVPRSDFYCSAGGLV